VSSSERLRILIIRDVKILRRVNGGVWDRITRRPLEKKAKLTCKPEWKDNMEVYSVKR
jgi:hypothetical protein